jgi:hypothetical protein
MDVITPAAIQKTDKERKWVTYTMDVQIDPSAGTAQMISMTDPVPCDPPGDLTLKAL